MGLIRSRSTMNSEGVFAVKQAGGLEEGLAGRGVKGGGDDALLTLRSLHQRFPKGGTQAAYLPIALSSKRRHGWSRYQIRTPMEILGQFGRKVCPLTHQRTACPPGDIETISRVGGIPSLVANTTTRRGYRLPVGISVNIQSRAMPSRENSRTCRGGSTVSPIRVSRVESLSNSSCEPAAP